MGSYGIHTRTAALLRELGATPITREEMKTEDAYRNFGNKNISIDHSGSSGSLNSTGELLQE